MDRPLEVLLRAAVLGMLAASPTACEDGDTSDSGQGGSGGSLDDFGSAGGGGEDGALEGVLSEKVIPDLSLEEFTATCDERGGVVEVHAHCGGLVSGPGLSYDSGTDVLTEHTCRGYNTCTGFSCVIES